MTSIPLAIFFVPYAIFLFVYFFFLAFNLYHLRNYGIKGFISHGLGTIFIVGTFIILGLSWIALAKFDWKQSVDLEEVTSSFTNTTIWQPL